MAKGMPEGEPIEHKSVSNGVRNAQKSVESRNFETRKNVLKYDDVMNKQRTVVYSERQAVLRRVLISPPTLRSLFTMLLHPYVQGATKGVNVPC